MTRGSKAIGVSLLFHATAFAGLILAGRGLDEPGAVHHLDFFLLEAPPAAVATAEPPVQDAAIPSPPSQKIPGTPLPPPLRKSSPAPVPPPAPEPAPRTAFKPDPRPAPPSVDMDTSAPPADPVVPSLSPKGPELLHEDSAAAGMALSESPPGNPAEAEHISESVSREKYLKTHFPQIREAVLRGIRYPAVARKKGWVGQVRVAFVILEDGGVEDIQVVSSSGFGVLDNSAVNAVRSVAPFPPPPVRAQVLLPITYRLN